MEYYLIDLLPHICRYSKNGAVMRAVCKLWRTAPESALHYELHIDDLCVEGNFGLVSWLIYDRPEVVASIDQLLPKCAIERGNLGALKFALFRDYKLPSFTLALAATADHWHIVAFLRKAGHRWQGDEFAAYLRPDISARLPNLDAIMSQFHCFIDKFAPKLIDLVAEQASVDLFDWIAARCSLDHELNVACFCEKLITATKSSNEKEILIERLLVANLVDDIFSDASLSALNVVVDIGSAKYATIIAEKLTDKETGKRFPRKAKYRASCELILIKAIRQDDPNLVSPIIGIMCGICKHIEDVVVAAREVRNFVIMDQLRRCQPDIFSQFDRKDKWSDECIYYSLNRNDIELAEYFLKSGCIGPCCASTELLIQKPEIKWESILFIKRNYSDIWIKTMVTANRQLRDIYSPAWTFWQMTLKLRPEIAAKIALFAK